MIRSGLATLKEDERGLAHPRGLQRRMQGVTPLWIKESAVRRLHNAPRESTRSEEPW